MPIDPIGFELGSMAVGNLARSATGF